MFPIYKMLLESTDIALLRAQSQLKISIPALKGLTLKLSVAVIGIYSVINAAARKSNDRVFLRCYSRCKCSVQTRVFIKLFDHMMCLNLETCKLKCDYTNESWRLVNLPELPDYGRINESSRANLVY